MKSTPAPGRSAHLSQTPAAGSFAQRVLDWQKVHGRHDLPWQHPRTPYRVWVAEIMLQQTTVATAAPYFSRFLERFPTLQALAAARLDAVLASWQGLGYYARARNLHACAQQLVTNHGGQFPRSRIELEALPGIGRSTAAAICAQAFGQAEAILDANVKRLLSRHIGLREWPGSSASHITLWQTAESRLPRTDLANYTQGVMDLGARICRARTPLCSECPVHTDCVARAQGLTQSIPAPNPKRSRIRPRRACQMAVLRRADGAIWLTRRPEHGIWGGLWSLPEFAPETARPSAALPLPSLRHVFTHFELDIAPWLLDHSGIAEAESLLPAPALPGLEPASGRWVMPAERADLGLPTPVRRILATLPT